MKTCHSHCHSSAVGSPADKTTFGYFIEMYGKASLMKNPLETETTAVKLPLFLPEELKSG
jgi:hypothetical protein